jgi:hypothetical protein
VTSVSFKLYVQLSRPSQITYKFTVLFYSQSSQTISTLSTVVVTLLKVRKTHFSFCRLKQFSPFLDKFSTPGTHNMANKCYKIFSHGYIRCCYHFICIIKHRLSSVSSLVRWFKKLNNLIMVWLRLTVIRFVLIFIFIKFT